MTVGGRKDATYWCERQNSFGKSGGNEKEVQFPKLLKGIISLLLTILSKEEPCHIKCVFFSFPPYLLFKAGAR